MPSIDLIGCTKIINALDTTYFLKNQKHIGVAVSGGVDSITLLNVASIWAKKFSRKLLVLSFNHNLRENSHVDVELVRKTSDSLGWEHKNFVWKEKPTTGILEKARIARYKIFSDYCKTRDIETLLVAHNADDIAETIAIRIFHNSNIDGLCPISRLRRMFGLNVVRPFLNVRKSEIYNFAKVNKIKFNEDPSNKNNKYLRSRIRKYLENNNTLSVNLIRASFIFCKLRNITYSLIKEKFVDYCYYKKEGYIVFKKEVLSDLPEFLSITLLKNCLMKIGNKKYPPRTKKLNRIYLDLKKNIVTNYSICGCIISSKKNEFLIIRESAKIQTLKTSLANNKSHIIWDNRFVISNLPKSNEYLIFPLGDIIEKNFVREILQNNKKYQKSLPFYVKKALPVIKTLEGSIFIPHFNIYGSLNKKIKVDINDFYNKNDNYNL